MKWGGGESYTRKLESFQKNKNKTKQKTHGKPQRKKFDSKHTKENEKGINISLKEKDTQENGLYSAMKGHRVAEWI